MKKLAAVSLMVTMLAVALLLNARPLVADIQPRQSSGSTLRISRSWTPAALPYACFASRQERHGADLHRHPVPGFKRLQRANGKAGPGFQSPRYQCGRH